jgi:hypothetical protein
MQISVQPMPLSPEVIDDRVAVLLDAGANITLNYDDAANVLTISSPGTLTGEWIFRNLVAMADPGSGNFCMNATTFASITALAFSTTTDGGLDAANVLGAIQAGDGLYLQSKSDSTIWARYTIDSVTNNTSWYQLGVTFVTSSAGMISNASPAIVQFQGAGSGGGGGGYTDEQAQDAVGNILQDSATIDFVYNDATPYVTGLVKDNSITEPMLNLSDVTTQNVSITKHGFVPKAPNSAAQYLDGTGAWSTPAGGTSYTDEQAQDAVGNILVDSATVNFTYNDTTPSITADVIFPTLTPIGAEYITSTANATLTAERVLTNTGTVTWDFATVGQAKANAIIPTSAPVDAEYVTSIANTTLSAERVLTDTATVTWDRTTAGQIKANASVPPGYTDEQAQDAVGTILTDSATIDFTYDDATPSITASLLSNSVTETHIQLSDLTADNASITQHGFLPKLSGTSTQYLDGTGAWTTPPEFGSPFLLMGA